MRNKRTYRLTESRLRGMIREAVKNTINEVDFGKGIEMGRGELSTDASYYRIKKALEGMKRIADTMSENNYYETEESALRSNINYIEQEIDYLQNH